LSERRLDLDHPVDLRFATVWAKTVTRRSGVHWWATRTPDGDGAAAIRVEGATVRAEAWGAGAAWMLEALPRLVGANDDPSGFPDDDPPLAALRRRFAAVRIGATGRWYEALVTTIVGQRVVTADAAASIRRLRHRYGSPAPAGPLGLLPEPETLLAITDHEFHQLGIERSRARVLRVAAVEAARAERLDGTDGAAARVWLQQLPGIGPWTAGIVAAVAGGDPDAVPVGDLHVPDMVCRALTGEGGDDARMLALLEPYAGHRGRVVRLAKLGGPSPREHRPKPFRTDITRW